MIARALWHLSAETSDWREAPLPPVQQGQCLLQSLYTFISLGTEKTVATCHVPEAIATHMEVPYMEGDFGLPVKYGYSLVGKIISAGHPQEGQLVHVMHPHQDLCVVDEKDVTLLPAGLPPKRAVLISNMETALNACWDAGLKAGNKVMVVGFGNIGALLAGLLSEMPELDVHIIDPDAARRAVAQKMGFTQVHASIPGTGFHTAFHSSGTQAGLQSCIDHLALEGQVIELSWYGNKPLTVYLGAHFHLNRIKIISSQVSNIPVSHRDNWDFAKRKMKVMELLQNPIFDHLLSREIPADEAPSFFNQLRKVPVRELGCYIRF